MPEWEIDVLLGGIARVELGIDPDEGPARPRGPAADPFDEIPEDLKALG